MVYDTYAVINMNALENNIKKLRERANDKELMVVLKADAYGHIATEIYKFLKECKVKYFAVANLIEALELRKADSEPNILVFGRINRANMKLALENNISISIFSHESLEDLLSVLSENEELKANVHIKINTGFNRLGFDYDSDVREKIINLKNNPRVNVEGIYSHLALKDEETDRLQYSRLMSCVDDLEKYGVTFKFKHIADSIGTVYYPWACLDMVRVGAAIYGLRTDSEIYDEVKLEGTMKLFASVNQVRNIKKGEGISYDLLYEAEKDMKIATISAGYADGIPRSLWKNGYVEIQGKKAVYTGLMCMDQAMVDVSGLDVKVGDKVTLFDFDENSKVFIGDIAKLAGTNKNEVIARIGKRVPRIYRYNDKEWIINQLL